MSFFRKTLKAAAITLGLVTVVCSLLWYRFSDNISPDMWRHAENVWNGYTPITGDRTPGEMIRYAKRRLEGHPRMESATLPAVNWLQARIERPVPPGPLPTFGKGQQPITLGYPRMPHNVADIVANSPQGIIHALNTAQAGQTILVTPGTYRFDHRIRTGFGGTAQRLITVRASQPGQVTIDFQSVEGFLVSHPYWVFENLRVRGVCQYHKDCEHAFHIVGGAHNIIIRNNYLVDFNAHIKVNGQNNQWPDGGSIQHNTVTNTGPRETHLPITPIDIVAASNWRIEDNLIHNFTKTEGNQISYGLFMKGGGSGGRIERNLVVCSIKDISQPGSRVGISFGGGTTGKEFCRNQRCDAEHTGGLVANNIVAHCNDSGIDVNRSQNIAIAHNTLINTSGIDLRGAQTTAHVYGNLLSGHIRERDGSVAQIDMNTVANLPVTLAHPPDSRQQAIDRRTEDSSAPGLIRDDFCGELRLAPFLAGATTQRSKCVASTAE